MGSKQEGSRQATISVDTLRIGDTLCSQALGTLPVVGIRSTTLEVVVEFADGSAIVYRHGADVEIEIEVSLGDRVRYVPDGRVGHVDGLDYDSEDRATALVFFEDGSVLQGVDPRNLTVE